MNPFQKQELTKQAPSTLPVPAQANIGRKVRLYRSSKYADYEIKTNEEMKQILIDNISVIARSFLVGNKIPSNAETVALNYIESKANETYNLNYYPEDASVRRTQTGFMSVWQYDYDELFNYMSSHDNSVEGFKGTLYTDYFYFDFDTHFGMIPTLEKLIPMLDDLKDNDKEFELYSSASKGWHIYMLKEYFNIPKEHEDKPYTIINKEVARYLYNKYSLFSIEKTIADNDSNTMPSSLQQVTNEKKISIIDTCIYNYVCAFRMPFSLNEKTGITKRRMFYKSTKELINEAAKEGITLKPEDIKVIDHIIKPENGTALAEALFSTLLEPCQMAKDKAKASPWITLTSSDLTYNIQAIHGINPISYNNTTVARDDKRKHPMYGKVCIYNILEDKLPSNKHNLALRLMSHWKEQKLPPSTVHLMLQDWARNLDLPLPPSKPLSSKEVTRLMNSWETVNYALCKDQYCLEYCPKNNSCVFNKIRLGTTSNDYADTDACMQAVRDFDGIDKRRIIKLSKFYEGNTIQMLPQEISAVVGGSGVGKSVVLQDLAIRCGRPTLVLSNEMNLRQWTYRGYKMLGLDREDPSDVELYKQLTKHIFIVSQNRPIQLLPDLVHSIEDKIGLKIDLVADDYFQIQSVADANNPKHKIQDGVKRADAMSEILPEMIRELDCHMLFAGQPTKEVQGGGMVPLTDESLKFGQAVQAMCGQIWTISRPFKDNPALDNVMQSWVVKNRDGELTGWLYHQWHGPSFTIGELLNNKPGFKQPDKQPITPKGG